jgi:hypothetical protein
VIAVEVEVEAETVGHVAEFHREYGAVYITP